jgi:hypothetical protein
MTIGQEQGNCVYKWNVNTTRLFCIYEFQKGEEVMEAFDHSRNDIPGYALK